MERVYLIDSNGAYGGIEVPCEVIVKQRFNDGLLMVQKLGSEIAQIVNPSQVSATVPYSLLDAE